MLFLAVTKCYYLAVFIQPNIIKDVLTHIPPWSVSLLPMTVVSEKVFYERPSVHEIWHAINAIKDFQPETGTIYWVESYADCQSSNGIPPFPEFHEDIFTMLLFELCDYGF